MVNIILKTLRKLFGKNSPVFDPIYEKVLYAFYTEKRGQKAYYNWKQLYNDVLGYNWVKISKDLDKSASNIETFSKLTVEEKLFIKHAVFFVFLCNIFHHKIVGYLCSNLAESLSNLYSEGFVLVVPEVYTWLSDVDFTGDLDFLSEVLLEIEDFENEFDYIGSIYQIFFTKKLRHSMGEYYTPTWLAELTLSRYDDHIENSFIDPSCGSGVFLDTIIKSKLHAGISPDEILKTVAGQDISPLAVTMTSINYMLNLRSHSSTLEITPPINIKDSIIDYNEQLYDFTIGNPPWVSWKHIPQKYRKLLIPVAERYNLFTHKGMKARLGFAQDDISVVFLYVILDKYLKNNGHASFILPQTLLKSFGGGEGFRKFHLDNTDIGISVEKVIDLSRINVFDSKASRSMIVDFCKNKTTSFPVQYEIAFDSKSSKNSSNYTPQIRTMTAYPIGNNLSSWLHSSRETLKLIRNNIRPSVYRARAGVCTWASSVFWVNILDEIDNCYIVKNYIESSRTMKKQVKAKVEKALIYNLVRGKDAARWSFDPKLSIIIPNNPEKFSKPYPLEQFQNDFPNAFDYLQTFKNYLSKRKGYVKYLSNYPFYAVYDIGQYTLGKYKAAYKYIDTDMRSCTLNSSENQKPFIPDLNLITISCDSSDESLYVSSMLNSSFIRLIVHSLGLCTRISPGVMNYLPIDKYNEENKSHRELVNLASKATLSDNKLDSIEKIDFYIAKMYNLTKDEIKSINNELNFYLKYG